MNSKRLFISAGTQKEQQKKQTNKKTIYTQLTLPLYDYPPRLSSESLGSFIFVQTSWDLLKRKVSQMEHLKV